MAFVPTIPGLFNSSFDPAAGRHGRRAHALNPSFDPLSLSADCLMWWDTDSLANGVVTEWADRVNNQALVPGGTGTLSFDGTMVGITTTAFLFGANAFTFPTPFEVWQIVDQTEPGGSTDNYSFSFGGGQSLFGLAYTHDIGGQCSAVIGGSTTFGGDDYHGVHVVRWGVASDGQLGYLDRKTGSPSSLSYNVPIEPASVYVGANPQGASLWKGRVGDLVITKHLSSPEALAMWNFMMAKAGL